MSDIRRGTISALEVVTLRPEQILTSPTFNVRPFSTNNNGTEDKLIIELARSMEDVGQLDNLLITPEHILVAGHRRRRAAIIINERRSARGESLFSLHCNVDHSGGDLRRKGIMSNLHRKDNSPMDLVYLIAQLRHENHWSGWRGTHKIAEYLSLDEATINQYERFHDAEKELQNKLHAGVISVQSALDIIARIAPKDQPAVIERAAEIQAEDRLEKAVADYNSGKSNAKNTTRKVENVQKDRIEHPAIVKAIRERLPVLPENRAKPIKRSRADILNALADLDADDICESGRSFIRYFVNEFASGGGSTDELRRRFISVAPDPIAVEHSTSKTRAS